jgi:Ser/Thr protein kinase RdoA (MazF antagonist)
LRDYASNVKDQVLKRLVIKALGQYELEVTDVQLLGVYSNTLFRVETAGGASYLLRICHPSWRTDTDLSSEIAWLQALNRDTDIGVPQPLPDREGKFIVKAKMTSSPEVRRCVMMSWVPGIQMGTELNETNIYKLGVLFAQLHDHAAHFTPPNDFTRRQANAVFALGERDILLGDSCRAAFTPRRREIFERTRVQVDAAFERLYADPAGKRVIHYDLHHNNVKLDHGCLHPFDFDFTMWGYPVQDLAVAWHGLLEVKQRKSGNWQSSLRAGYETILSWPESYAGQIDTFVASRMLWAGNYLAQFERAHLSEYIEGLEPRLAGFLKTGVLGMEV